MGLSGCPIKSLRPWLTEDSLSKPDADGLGKLHSERSVSAVRIAFALNRSVMTHRTRGTKGHHSCTSRSPPSAHPFVSPLKLLCVTYTERYPKD